MATVTQNGMTNSQPGISCSLTDPAYGPGFVSIPGKVRLNVHRHYYPRGDVWAGPSKIKNCDHDGKLFDTAEQAWKFAEERGYIRQYYKKMWRTYKR